VVDGAADPRVRAALAKLTEAQRAELALALARRRDAAAGGLLRLARTGPGQLFPASYGQERLWFLDQLHPGSPAYVVPVALRLSGPLDAAALARALSTVVGRHEALRTTFPALAGRPWQRVAAPAPVPLDVVDLAGAPPGAVREAQLDEARLPFDLATGPLLRARLLRRSGAEHVLLLTLHHIVADGWSLALVVDELLRHYHQPDAAGADPPPPQYPDAAAWQRDWLASGVLDRHLAYWRQALRGAPPLRLPTDRARAGAAPDGAALPVHWPAPLVTMLAALARQHRATLFMAVLAGLCATLARWGAQDELVVGTPVAGRPRAELERVVGFFANTLAVRLPVDPAATFAGLLAGARDACLDAFAHQDAPYEKVVDALRPDRGGTPLVEAMLALRNVPVPAPAVPGLAVELLPAPVAAAKFDLTWELAPDAGGGLTGRLEYAAGLFDEATVAALHASVTALLWAGVQEPDAPLSRLPWPDVPAGAGAGRRDPATRPARPPDAAPAQAAPRDALERLLVRAWGELLQVERVSAVDDFFAIGGHSLLITQAVSQVRETFGLAVPLDGAMTATTVRDFAGYLRELGAAAGVDVDRVAERAAAGEPPAPPPPGSVPRRLDRDRYRQPVPDSSTVEHA
jgi:hypothetical protein